MAKPQRLLSTENRELFDQNLDDRPTGVTVDLPLQVRVESGQGAFETRLAAHTRFKISLATPLLARSLNLKRLPVSPSQRPRMYETPFGLLSFNSFVHLSVQAPEAGIPCTSVNVLVLEDDHQWHNVDLFLGQNFRAKAMNVIASPNISSFQSLKDQQQVQGANHVAVTSQMRTPAIAPKPLSTTPEASTDLMGINNQRSSRPDQSALEAHRILDDHQISPSVTPPTSLIEAQHNKGLISELLKETPSRMMSIGVPRISTEAEEPELSSGLEDTLAQLTGRSEPLMCLISEIRHSSPVKMIMSTSCKTSWTDHVKLALEELTKHRWTWWPFTPPKQPLKDNECHLEWTCSCGEKRWENVPFDFGQVLVEFVRQRSPSARASETKAAPVVSTENRNSGGNPPNIGSSNILSSSGGTSYPETVVQNESDNTIAGQPQIVDTREKHIFLVASSGSLNLHQIISTAQCTMDFSNNLRKGYRQLRGFWRYWFSIYKFSHCDFFEFEKFCSSTFSDLGPGLPPEEYPYTEDYFYKPRPARSKTPISPKEFEHIYYHYRKTSAARINTWYQPFTVMAQAPFYWPRFFRQPPPLLQQQIDGNLPTDTVPKIPQRLTHFDELSNSRETFWGLHAREQISAMMVLIYALLAFTPSLAFCFIYWFGLGDKQPDMQNATTPLTISLTTFGLFMAYLVKH